MNMLNKLTLSISLSLLTISLLSVTQAEIPTINNDQQTKLANEARSIIKKYGHTLKNTLKTGLKSGGPVKAIESCHLKAPDIASDMPESSEWSIRRTSMKTRGLDNAPDKWEMKVLKHFKEQKNTKKNFEYYEIVKNKEGKSVFRYMKPIFIKKVCLKCHGEHIKPKVASQLASLYPFDQATGYKKGDLRGAFTLSLLLNKRQKSVCKSPAFKQQDTCWKPLNSYQKCTINTISQKSFPTLAFCPENKINHLDSLQGYKLISVEDGDTIVINYKGKNQRVQLIGIDAPENTVNPKLNLDASQKSIGISFLLEMGYLSTEHLKGLLKKDVKVYLVGDLNKKDKYGRLSAIVINNKGESLNQQMVKDGFALLLTRFPIQENLRKVIAKAQQTAQQQKTGLWGTHAELMKKWSQ